MAGASPKPTAPLARPAGSAADLPPPPPPKARVFISYQRRDQRRIEQIADLLRKDGNEVWYDQDLGGGEQWWERILDEIRKADVFLFAISPNAIRSPACEKERKWAHDLGTPFLSVTLSTLPQPDFDRLRAELQLRNFVSFVDDAQTAAVDLTRGVDEMRRQRKALPERLPTPPDAPMTDFEPLRLRLEQANEDEETQLIDELEDVADRTDHYKTVLDLIRIFLQRDLRPSARDRLEQLSGRVHAKQQLDDLATARDNWQPRRATEILKEHKVKDGLSPFVDAVREQQFVPILGWGMTDSLMGPARFMLERWATEFSWPGGQNNDDLSVAAEFIRTKRGAKRLVDAVKSGVAWQIHNWRRREARGHPQPEDGSLDVVELMRQEWDEMQREREADPSKPPDPHRALAELPCAIYVTAHPWDLMERALRETPVTDEHGEPLRDANDMVVMKDPVVEVCWWKPEEAKWNEQNKRWPPPSPLWTEQGTYRPSVAKPLVYHVFGRIEYPPTLVLSQGDYLDFLRNVSNPSDGLIPGAVAAKLATSAKLILGFGLDDLSARVLLRTLLSNEGESDDDGDGPPRNIGWQDRHALDVRDERYEEYVAETLQKFKPPIGVFSGKVEEFTAVLAHELGVPHR